MIKHFFSVLLFTALFPFVLAQAQIADEFETPPDDAVVFDDAPEEPLPEEKTVDEDVPELEQIETENPLKETETGELLNGTLSDEDPDNQTPEKEKERNLFGSDEADPEDDDGDGPLVSDYTFKLEFNTRVIFADKISGIPYMEINYTNKLELPIEVSTKKKKNEAKMESIAEVTGTLSQNELYRCELQVSLQETKAQLQTRHIKIEEKEDKPGESTLAIQLKFPKKPEEDWISDCLATDGSKFKTQGNPEFYNALAFEAISPDLSALTFEDYDAGDSTKIDLYSEQTEVDDFDTGNYITITGSGSLEIEYSSGVE
jgi:hypothetical protein